NGDYVVAWLETNPTTFDEEIHGRVFSSGGAAIGGELELANATNSSLFGEESVASVALAALPASGSFPTGGFVLAYEVNDLSTGNDQLAARIFTVNAAGTVAQVGNDFAVNTDPNIANDIQDTPAIAVAADGSFMVTWQQVVG